MVHAGRNAQKVGWGERSIGAMEGISERSLAQHSGSTELKTRRNRHLISHIRGCLRRDAPRGSSLHAARAYGFVVGHGARDGIAECQQVADAQQGGGVEVHAEVLLGGHPDVPACQTPCLDIVYRVRGSVLEIDASPRQGI